jgi:hypothetical protein
MRPLVFAFTSSGGWHKRQKIWIRKEASCRANGSVSVFPVSCCRVPGLNGRGGPRPTIPVLIQTIEPEAGGVPQFLVTLNGQSFTDTLEPGQTVRVDLLGGNDVLGARITVVPTGI